MSRADVSRALEYFPNEIFLLPIEERRAERIENTDYHPTHVLGEMKGAPTLDSYISAPVQFGISSGVCAPTKSNEVSGIYSLRWIREYVKILE